MIRNRITAFPKPWIRWAALSLLAPLNAAPQDPMSPDGLGDASLRARVPDPGVRERAVANVRRELVPALPLVAAAALAQDPREEAIAAARRSPWGWFREEFIDRFNLKASLNLDFVAGFLDAREKAHEDAKRAFLREAELALSADLTPTIWLDLFLATEREGDEFFYDLEEGYLTFLALPLGLQAKAGKFLAAFGKANTYHTHQRPWVDSPLALEVMFGEEGLAGTGVSVTRLIPNPWNVFSELTVEIFGLDKDTALAELPGRGDGQVLHWRNVFELNPATTLDLGLSAARLSLREGGHGKLIGADATLRWRPLDQALYRSLTWQNEFYFLRNDPDDVEDEEFWGAYTSLEYQFSRRWYAGLRLDAAEIPEQIDTAWAIVPFLTFRQTERIYWRLQFNHTRHDPEMGDRASNELRLQMNLSLGVHRPHPY